MVGKRLGRVAHTGFLWLWTGFSGGAVVLLLIATPIEAWMKRSGATAGMINRTLTIVALLWVVGSFLLARKTAAWAQSPRRAAIAHGAGLGLAGLVFGLFLMVGAGALARLQGDRQAVGDHFVFGPFPDADDMFRLKDDRFDAVVTLLSPAVPFEAVLRDQERETAAAAGLRLIEVPMLPWVSANEDALKALRDLAVPRKGRYYVHCYLGRHRVDLARYAIAEVVGRAAAEPETALPPAIERGAITKVSETLAVGPLPARDEWFAFIVRSGTRRVISMLDPQSPDDLHWLEAEREQARSSGIELVEIPVRSEADAGLVVAALGRSHARTYVHGFLAGDSRAVWVLKAVKEPPR